jgi:hypothetical protein
MLVKEPLSATTVIGQHDALFLPVAYCDAYHCWQESPTRTTVDVQYVVCFQLFAQSAEKPYAPKE